QRQRARHRSPKPHLARSRSHAEGSGNLVFGARLRPQSFYASRIGRCITVIPYDAIIVGARSAGSRTTMLLPRKEYRVLLVDRPAFPSDTISTHIVWPPVVPRLARTRISIRALSMSAAVSAHSSLARSPAPYTTITIARCLSERTAANNRSTSAGLRISGKRSLPRRGKLDPLIT